VLERSSDNFHIVRRILFFLVASVGLVMTNSLESTSIIISIPPGKILLVVISRSLCECHMNAKASLAGGRVCDSARRAELCRWARLRGRRIRPKVRTATEQAPFAKMFGSGRVTGPPPATLPNGAVLHRLAVVLTPLVIVDRRLRPYTGVVAVGIRRTGKVSGRRKRIVTVRIPVQTLGRPVENPVEGHPRSRGWW